MGALCLLPPGRGALCAESCDHPRCKLVREIAATRCKLCHEPLGFKRAIYCYATRMGHAEAMDDAYDRSVEHLVREFAVLAAKLYIEEHHPNLAKATPAGSWEATPMEKPTARRRRRKPSKPYVLPEFDFQFNIPTGRGPKRPTVHLEQQHHLLWPGEPDEVPLKSHAQAASTKRRQKTL